MTKTVGIFTLYMVVSLAAILSKGCRTETPFETIIEDIRLLHVPDSREGVYEVQGKRTGWKEITLLGEVDSENVKNLLLDSLMSAGFVVMDSIRVLPADVPWPWALIDISVANIRFYPSHRSELVNQALMGTPVKVLKEQGSWVFIQTPDQYLGWCEKASMSGRSDNALSDWKSSEKAIFTKTSGYIKDPDGNRTISDVVAGAIFEKTGIMGGIISVRLPDGREGTVASGDIADFDFWRQGMALLPARLTETALTMIGFPYLWGGTSVKGLDCSGFTRIVFFMNGMIIPRDASLQARHGNEIDVAGGWDNFEPGDLLFFRANPDAPDNSTVIHVAIYKGDSEYIHAAGRVMVNSLDSTRDGYNAYRSSTLQSVRRITPEIYDDGLVPVTRHPWY